MHREKGTKFEVLVNITLRLKSKRINILNNKTKRKHNPDIPILCYAIRFCALLCELFHNTLLCSLYVADYMNFLLSNMLC